MVALSDNFNRADSSSLGAGWVDFSGSAGVGIAGNVAIANNPTDVNGSSDAINTTVASTFAAFSQATFICTDPTNADMRVSILADPTTQGFLTLQFTGNNSTVRFREYYGSGVTRASATLTMAAATTYLMRIEVSAAGVVDGYVNGTKVLTYGATPASYTQRAVGFALGGTATADDWSGGDLVAGPAVPAQVTGLGATPSTTSVALAWTNGADNGSTITDSLIEVAPDASGSPGTYAPFTHTALGTTNSITVTGLTQGTKYWFRVSNINAIGTGSASTAVTTTTLDVPAAPAAPNVRAQHHAVEAWLDAAPADGGTAITDYVWAYAPGPGYSSWSTFSEGTSTSLTAPYITGLTAGTSYKIRVSAVSSVGASSPSSPSAAVTALELGGSLALEDGTSLLALENNTILGTEV